MSGGVEGGGGGCSSGNGGVGGGTSVQCVRLRKFNITTEAGVSECVCSVCVCVRACMCTCVCVLVFLCAFSVHANVLSILVYILKPFLFSFSFKSDNMVYGCVVFGCDWSFVFQATANQRAE